MYDPIIHETEEEDIWAVISIFTLQQRVCVHWVAKRNGIKQTDRGRKCDAGKIRTLFFFSYFEKTLIDSLPEAFLYIVQAALAVETH